MLLSLLIRVALCAPVPREIDCPLRQLALEFGKELLGDRQHLAQHISSALQIEELCPNPTEAAKQAAGLESHSRPGRHWYAAQIFVSPNGSDSAQGTEASPFQTIDRALEASRAIRASEPRAIVLRAGVYYLTAPIDLDSRDSQLTIEAFPSESVVVSGGRPFVPQFRRSRSNTQILIADGIPGNFSALFVDGVQMVRARHPNGHPETDVWPRSGYFPVEMVPRHKTAGGEAWMPSPAWQTEPELITVKEPNYDDDGGLPSGATFTTQGGMSPYYQAKVGGAMRRFHPPIAPGPQRSNCYQGCSVPGGVWHTEEAFAGVQGPPWEKPQTGIVHALHPLNTISGKPEIPWYNWQWRVRNTTAPAAHASARSQCGLDWATDNSTGCCGAMSVGAPVKLPSFNRSACVALCCASAGCGVAVLTLGQSHEGEALCWLTNLSEPVELLRETNFLAQTLVMKPAPQPTPPMSQYPAIIFADGGWQSGQGAAFGSQFYVENILELLDSPGEWYHDKDTQRLYLFPNSSNNSSSHPHAHLAGAAHPDLSNSTFVGAELMVLVRVRGSPSATSSVTSSVTPPVVVRDVTIRGVTFRHAAADFMESYEVPGGGDQSVHRGAAVAIEGAERVTIANCTFDTLGGSGVIVSRYSRNASIVGNEFIKTGSAGVIVLGEANLINGTRTSFPRGTLIEGNVIRDGGLWSKNYLGGSIFQALAAESTIRRNIVFNCPRACLTFNDNFGGGDILEGNLMFNCNRESSDSGVVYTYNRLPFLTTVRTGEPSLIAANRHIRYNLMISNYGSNWALDHDDGSSWYLDYANVLVYSGTKHSTFSNGGHSKHTFTNLFLFPDLKQNSSYGCNDMPCAAGGGYFETWSNNTCVLHHSQQPYANGCPSLSSLSTIPRRWQNRYMTASGNVSIPCDGKLWSISDAEAHGTENGSTSSSTPPIETVVSMAKALLSTSSNKGHVHLPYTYTAI